MDLQKGDRVRITVVGTVESIQDYVVGPNLYIVLDEHTGRYAFNSSKIENIERISLKVGDSVVPLAGGLVRKILALHGEHAWLDDGGAKGGPQTYLLNQMRLAI